LAVCRVATRLEILKKPGNLRMVREKGKVRKMCSCVWSFTASIVVDTKYARQEFYSLLGKVVNIEHSCHSYERMYE